MYREGVDIHHMCHYTCLLWLVCWCVVPEEKMTVSNCCLIEDGNLALSQVVDESCSVEDLEDKWEWGERVMYRIVPNVYIIVGGTSGSCYIWPAMKKDGVVEPKVFNAHDAPCLYFDHSTYCNLVASSSQDHTLKVWKGVSYICLF